MKFRITFLALFLSFVGHTQVTNEGKPQSWLMSNLEGLNPIEMPEFDLKNSIASFQDFDPEVEVFCYAVDEALRAGLQPLSLSGIGAIPGHSSS